MAGQTASVAPPDPFTSTGEASTTTARASPMFVIPTFTAINWPTETVAGAAITLLAILAAIWIVADVPAEARTTGFPHVVPVTPGVNATSPAPAAENVQTKVREAPTATVTGPAGDGGPSCTTSAAPGATTIAGLRPVTSHSPVLVTVRDTANHSPVET